ncbi:hypothetical protein GLOTRDRAFT_92429 [Gloeophyllum trabeum ATCC 11539]|uniref:Uncharacterized protein n=1 Tax=Gloeophyllum trabeum (strain ATCC 11539 / FP-39264 / Madison 617) TaxID=670483 RepID=S7RRW2_GLOTA|nr:uncharacterized protein GLOTRDRAFT_92429 [Gloeophyllum trabeum ATCC 11539]EPQ57380.1 hypothetical protein GLOTRDRAFT_92429 [Gloeophyllum trabeum ATCC 11539]
MSRRLIPSDRVVHSPPGEPEVQGDTSMGIVKASESEDPQQEASIIYGAGIRTGIRKWKSCGKGSILCSTVTSQNANGKQAEALTDLRLGLHATPEKSVHPLRHDHACQGEF